MSRVLIAALLAQSAFAKLDIPQTNGLANVVAAATTTDPGLLACVTAEAVLDVCFDIPNFTNAPEASQAACICCLENTYLAPDYSSCASYIKTSAAGFSSDYSLNSAAASYCRSQGNVCSGGATATPTGTGSKTTRTGSVVSSTSKGVTGKPTAACTSLNSVLSSCAKATPGFTTMKDPQAASCVCYDSSGDFTTAFDNYASGCAAWASTSATSDYSDLAVLTTFCEDYEPTTTTSSTRRTSTSSSSRSGTTTVTTTPASGQTTGAPPPNAAGRAVSDPVAWAANAFTFVLSFFFLI